MKHYILASIFKHNPAFSHRHGSARPSTTWHRDALAQVVSTASPFLSPAAMIRPGSLRDGFLQCRSIFADQNISQPSQAEPCRPQSSAVPARSCWGSSCSQQPGLPIIMDTFAS